MEFFIAFFGGLFLLIHHIARVSGEQQRAAQTKTKYASADIAASALRPSEEDWAAVKEIMDTWSGEKLAEYLEEDLKEVFGENFRKIVPLNNSMYRSYERSWSPYVYVRKRSEFRCSSYFSYWVYRLLLSKRNKIDDIFVGIGDPEIDIAMCRRIEKNVTLNGKRVHLGLDMERWITDHDRWSPSGRVYAEESKPSDWKHAGLEAIREMPCVYKDSVRRETERMFNNRTV